jgi:non-ribosomal peptide synthetase component F
MQYADFASWQRQWQSYPDMVAQLAYWRAQLRGPLPVMELAPVRTTRTVEGLRTARRELTVPPQLAEGARRFSQGEGGTLFMALTAALKTLLHRFLGVDDVRVATLVANRNRPGTEALIGPLVNTVILRTNLGGDPSAREVLRRVRATTLAAYAHQDLPFEELVRALQPGRGLQPVALSPAMILLHNATLRPVESSRHTLTFEEADPSVLLPLVTLTPFDLVLSLRESTHELAGCCVYKPQRLSALSIDRLLGDFHKVLDCMVRQPERPISAIRVSRSAKA